MEACTTDRDELGEPSLWTTERILRRVEDFRLLANLLVDLSQIKKRASVLDIGTGLGILPLVISDRKLSCKVIGIDISEPRLERARHAAEHSRANVTFMKMNAESLEFDDESFDVVISQAAIGLFADKNKALLEMARVLRKGGVLLVSDAFGKDGSGVQTIADMKEMLEDAGLSANFMVDFSDLVTAMVRDGKWNWSAFLSGKLEYWAIKATK